MSERVVQFKVGIAMWLRPDRGQLLVSAHLDTADEVVLAEENVVGDVVTAVSGNVSYLVLAFPPVFEGNVVNLVLQVRDSNITQLPDCGDILEWYPSQ